MQTKDGSASKPSAGWAACPSIELAGTTEKPKLFPTKFDAICWLKRPLPEPSPEDIAKQFSLRVEDVIAGRSKAKARYKLCKAMYDHGILSALAFPSHLEPRTPDSQGFQKPVPISLPVEESGPAGKPLTEFLPLSAIGRWIPKFDMNDELSRVLDGTRLSPAVRCCLDRKWSFDDIEADSWKRRGHEYAGMDNKSIAEIIVKALYDLDVSLDKFHPKLSNSARSDFWRSWQVDNHIAQFCDTLATSDEAKALAREPAWVTNETRRARAWAYLQLELYAAELKAVSTWIACKAEPKSQDTHLPKVPAEPLVGSKLAQPNTAQPTSQVEAQALTVPVTDYKADTLEAAISLAGSCTQDAKLTKKLLAVVRYEWYFRELKTVKVACKKYQTPKGLKAQFPDLAIWDAIESADVQDLAEGKFQPGYFAWAIVQRVEGLNSSSNRTLKNYRKAIRTAGLADWMRVFPLIS